MSTTAALARARLAELDHVYRNTPVALALIDTDLRFLRVNEMFAALHGLSPRDHIGRGVLEVVPSKLLDTVASMLRRTIETGEPVLNLEMDGVCADAATRMVGLVSCHPLKSPGGATKAVTIVLQDITERKRAEEALEESKRRMATIIESAMDGIVVFDGQHVVRLFNAAAEAIFRCPAEEALGRSFLRFAPASLRDVLDRCVESFDGRNGNRAYLWAADGLTAFRADGEEFPIEATVARATHEGQELFTVILRDVNDRKRAEQRLARLEVENAFLREEIGKNSEFQGIVGDSAGVRGVIEKIERVAATRSTVLITGETGTGKELVARAIHELSSARNDILVTVNCAALPAGVIESELFGHEKGAFTGALARRPGRFEVADGGTIFLDEIGDLPVDLQAKLLRVLQSGEFERVGGTKTFRTNARVLAATNRDLAEAVKDGQFRADLYYRLNVFPIEVPPLRARAGDIPSLVRHFAMILGTKIGKRVLTIPDGTMRALVAYPWPGNVRELQNVIERGIILATGMSLDAGDWIPRASAAVREDLGIRTLKRMEKEHILEALEQTGWRVSGKHGAAALLDIKPTTLEARMKKLGIVRPSARRAPTA